MAALGSLAGGTSTCWNQVVGAHLNIDWGKYQIIEFEVAAPWAELTPAEARRCFEKIMSDRGERVAMLNDLVTRNGYEFGQSDVQLQNVNDFFRLHVEKGSDTGGYPSAEWGSVAYDIGLFVGEVLIDRFPQLRWGLDTTKRSTSVNQPVIVGFTKAHARYNLPVFDRFVSYGYQILNPGPSEHTVRDDLVTIPNTPVDEALVLRLVAGASQYA